MRLARSVLLLFVAAAAALAAAPRVALHVDSPAAPAGTPAAAEWQAALTAELSRLAPEAELVERAELARLWREREATALAVSTPPAVTPAPLALDRYLHFRRVAPSRWIVEHLDAATGRALGSFAVEAADLDSAHRLAEAAARLLAAPPPADPAASAPRIAIVEAADAAGDAALFTLAARLRAALADEGLVVLDRALTQEIAVEQNDSARGFRSAPPAAALLGLDAYLHLSPREARLVRVRDGVVLGLRPRAAASAAASGASEPADEANALQAWALPLLNRPAAAATDYLPQVETEALEPFYRGIAHFDAGRFAEAIGEFTCAYELNGRFREAYEWSARAHEALGLPEVAASIRRFLDTEFLENLVAPTGRLTPVDGLAFLGVGGPALDPALRDALAAAIASGLASRRELGLRLPAELARLRLEFDWARLGEAVPAAPPEPAFFTRRVLAAEAAPSPRGVVVTFTLRDSLGLRPTEQKRLALSTDPTRRATELSRFLDTWPPTREAAPTSASFSAQAASPPPAQDPARLAAAIAATGSESIADADRVRLLLAAPGHPLGIVRRSEAADDPLTTFVEHGRAASAIRRLPTDDPARRWLELLRAVQHLDPLGPGRLYSGRELSARAELTRLATQIPDDGAGLAARYHLLFLGQADRHPREIAAEAEALRAAAVAGPDFLGACATPFAGELAALARLARLAYSPEPEDLEALERFRSPTDLGEFRFTPEGQLSFAVKRYAMTRLTFAGLSPAEAAANARALLALNGRGNARDAVTPMLLVAHPRAPAITQHLILHLSHSLNGRAMPAGTADDWAGRRALALASYHYALDQLGHAFETQTDVEALKNSQTLATGLLGVLGHARLVEWLPEDAHARAHAQLSAAAAAARARVMFPRNYNPNALNIADLTPETVRAQYADDFRPHGIWIADAANIQRLLLGREVAFDDPAKASTRRSWWWLAARWETKEAFTMTERAALLARPLDSILRDAAPDPDDAELGRLFELGLFLLDGKRLPDAERVLAPLVALPVRDDASRQRRVFIANAHFRLAQLHHVAGRLPEAFDTARRGLALATGHTLPFHTESLAYIHTEADLDAQLLRLLAELRHAPERLDLPPGVGFVRVPTRQGDNPLLTVYYRLPPPPLPGATPAPAPPRVLLLSFTFNQDPLETLATPGPWTRFADAHNLVLVSPRFRVASRVDRAEHLFTHPRFASAWSGEAVLRAVELIAERAPIDASRLLVYGRVSGSGFASQLAAWRPDRFAAVALAHGNWGVANQSVQGSAPLSALRQVRHWIGANSWDNHDVARNSPRFAYLQDFAGRLRAADVPLEWEEFSAPTSAPTPEMEDAARAFLARQLSP
jgi:hypothetical protein